MKRRSFIQRSATTLLAITGAALGFSYLKQFLATKANPLRRVRLGKVSDFPVGAYTYLSDHKVYVYRDHEKMQVISAVCTHLGCTVKYTDQGFECPCHGSCYTKKGEVISGPAPSALTWYELQRLDGDDVMVDLDRKVAYDEPLFL